MSHLWPGAILLQDLLYGTLDLLQPGMKLSA